ncbi:MAG: molybdopterin-binding protein [Aigarchaeota archaeon]|nr:molybdopterin-binding protein [Aigarchaeota archaeon]MDW8092337.1 molybdopterin-binding protein [Nitrososphaerota archaeon]
MRRKSRIEIVVVGNEILDGTIQDTNSNWIVKQIYDMGGVVSRITSVRDDVREVSTVFRESIRRRTKWIISCGGLGPTFDDITIAAVGEASGRRLRINRVALSMIAERYRELKQSGRVSSDELTPHRIKMAVMPVGSRPLRNPVGTAPAMLLKVKGSNIVCLPGVPSEMKEIFVNEVRPLLERGMRRVHRVKAWGLIRGVPESVLAPRIEAVSSKVKSVYIKSHPQGFEGGTSKILLEITSESDTPRRAGESLAKAVSLINSELSPLNPKEVRFSPSRDSL